MEDNNGIENEIDQVYDYDQEVAEQKDDIRLDEFSDIYSDSSKLPEGFRVNEEGKDSKKGDEIENDEFIRDDDFLLDEKARKETRDEKKFNRLKTKLENLRIKLEANPPKSIIGKKLAMARLNRLSNMVDKLHLKNSLIQLSKIDEKENYKRYYNAQQSIMEDISDLEYERESVLRSIDRLYRYIPSGRKSMFAEQQKTVAKNMPKGYKLKSNENVQDKTNARKQMQQLEARLEEIEREIEEKENTLESNDEIYKAYKEELKEELKSDLAMVSPNIFTRVKNFFVSKIEQFRAWREQRKEKANQDFSEALKNSETSSLRESVKVDSLTPEAQAEYAKKIQEELKNKQTITGREDIKQEKE